MNITILGSGTGVPTKRRSAPGLVIKAEEKFLLFDSGSGAAYQMARAGIDYHNLHYLFYSHFAHPDHVNDLAEIVFANKYDYPKREKDLCIYGPRGMKNFYQQLTRLFPVINTTPFTVTVQELGKSQIKLDNILIESMPLSHQKVECLGYRIESGGKSIVYSGDTDYCENLVNLSQNADLLILECSFPDHHKVDGHLTPQLAGLIAKEARTKKLLLTHFYPMCDKYDLKIEAKGVFEGEICLAEDFMKLKI